MRSTRISALLLLALVFAGLVPALAREAPKPATNDFLLRVPASKIDKIARDYGLEVVGVVTTSPDALGRSVFLARAPLGYDPDTLLAEIRAGEPDTIGAEEAFLASLPETYEGLALNQRTRAILEAVQQASRLLPPGGIIDSAWIGPEADRDIAAGATAPLELEFQSAASADPAAYALTVGLAPGLVSRFDPAGSSRALGHGDLGFVPDKSSLLKWKITNLGSQALALSSLTLSWPRDNGDLKKIWLGSTEIFGSSRKPTSTVISSGWKVPPSQLQIAAGATQELTFEFAKAASRNLASYALTAAFAGGGLAQFATGGIDYLAAVHAFTVSGNRAAWRLTNAGRLPLRLSSLSPAWPQGNGRLTAARLAGKELIDTTIEAPFGTHPDGSPRYVWRPYVQQAAAALLRVDEAIKSYQGAGAVVAVIDSGVDPDHPLLKDALLPGYDFTRDLPGTASEWSDLDQRTRAILEQRTRAILEGNGVVTLNASTSVVLDTALAGELDPAALPPGFGHGTMVAGVIHRVAPKAKILPLKAFNASGQGHLFDVVRAIYYAADRNVTAINMSFSLETFSPELMRAINYAAAKGIACVASAGNDGRSVLVYPAALGNAIGVASTSAEDRLSTFSNRGGDLVTIAAPGENLITTYPGGHWALASGTSFAAPWITGIVAVFAERNGRGVPDTADYYLSTEALAHASPVAGDTLGDAGYGRADFYMALSKLKGGLTYDTWPRADYRITGTFGDACAADYPPLPEGGSCAVAARTQLDFKGQKVTWTLTNRGSGDAAIRSLTVQWPAENGRLRKIHLNGTTLWQGEQAPSSLTIDLRGVPPLAPGQSGDLVLEFQYNALRS